VAGGDEIKDTEMTISGPPPPVSEKPEADSSSTDVRAVGGVAGGGDISGSTITIQSGQAPVDKPE
jgi:hypothetical protein